jgi:hypothetical protein
MHRVGVVRPVPLLMLVLVSYVHRQAQKMVHVLKLLGATTCRPMKRRWECKCTMVAGQNHQAYLWQYSRANMCFISFSFLTPLNQFPCHLWSAKNEND